MNTILFRAATLSPAIPLSPFLGDSPAIQSSPERAILDAEEPNRQSIRHLLIGPPEAVHLTVHRLHQLGYAEAGLWSPAITPSSTELTLTLSHGEVMRILRRSV